MFEEILYEVVNWKFKTIYLIQEAQKLSLTTLKLDTGNPSRFCIPNDFTTSPFEGDFAHSHKRLARC